MEKPPELSTEKPFSAVEPSTHPGQSRSKYERTAHRNGNVETIKGLVLDHVDEDQVLTQRGYKHELELGPEREDADNQNRQSWRDQYGA